MKIREIYTVVREHDKDPEYSLEDIKDHCLYVLDEAGEFLYGGSCGEESLSVKFQIDNGNGWEDFDPEE